MTRVRGPAAPVISIQLADPWEEPAATPGDEGPLPLWLERLTSWSFLRKGQTEAALREALHHAWQASQTPPLNALVLPAPDYSQEALNPPLEGEGGVFTWNRHAGYNLPQNHEDIPLWLAPKESNVRMYIEAGGDIFSKLDASVARSTVFQWVANRAGIRGAVQRIHGEGPKLPGWAPVGFWVTFELTSGNRPQSTPPPGAPLMRCMHGMRMQSLNVILVNGLRVGMTQNTRKGGGPLSAIYSHPFDQATGCASYITLSPIGGNGWLCAPVLDLTIPATDPFGRPSTAPGRKANVQKLSYTDTTHIQCVHLWLVHALELAASPRAGNYGWGVERRYNRMTEIHPADSWDSILQRSVAQRAAGQ
jgi:hypothetical protein